MANKGQSNTLKPFHSSIRHSLRRSPLGALFNTLTRRHKQMKLPGADGKENQSASQFFRVIRRSSQADIDRKTKSTTGFAFANDSVTADSDEISCKIGNSAAKNGGGLKPANSVQISSQSSSFQSYIDTPDLKEPSHVLLVRVKDIGEIVEKDFESIERHRSAEEGFSTAEGTCLFDEETMIEARKHFLAPSNPPPPVPPLKNGSPLKMLNGGLAVSNTANLATNGHTRAEPLKLENLKPALSSGLSTLAGLTTKPASDPVKSMRTLQLNGHVGFDSLPHQLVRKCTDQGFQFNLMCVGETGMGKTTLIESLFNMKLEFPPCNNELKTVELLSKTYDVTEGGIHLKLTIVETAGFGDQLDKDKSAQVIGNFINEQFEKYLKEELKIKRCLEYYDDTRIHACLYFISPTGHGLKALDVVTMRRLSERVNVIPIIAKADTTCKDELVRFKSKILSELRSHNIPIYQFPTDDETVRAVNTELNQLLPYAVVGSTDFVKKENGKMVRARRYPWGIVEVENEQHCDFVKLREAVLRTNVDSLRERTHKVLYESYRRERLRAMKVGDGDTGPKILEAFSQKQKEFADDMAHKEKVMREEFIARVNKKEEEMKRREELLNMRAKEIKENFDEELKRLESQMNTLAEEKLKLETKAGKKLRK